MARMSDRHEGNLGGVLPEFDDRRSFRVRVVVEGASAAHPAVQHTAWMVLNLLARTDGIVREVVLDCPETPLADFVVPFGQSDNLESRLHEASNSIGGAPVLLDDRQPADRTIHVGRSPGFPVDIAVVGSGWWGGMAVGASPDWTALDLDSEVPFGPYMAATFAVGELYLSGRGLVRPKVAEYGWDVWASNTSRIPSEARSPVVALNSVALAGVGAVGAAWMHALWGYPGSRGEVAIVDADVEGVNVTNLNRGILFRAEDVGKPKAQAAAEAAIGRVSWAHSEGRYEESGLKPDLLVSAVDSNTSRDALQFTYRPRMLGGSTHDLRAEVLRVGSPGVGACLRCYNRPESRTSDDEVRRRAMERVDLIDTAVSELNLSPASVSDWLNKPECGQISVELMSRLREQLDDSELPQFSVGFVSVAAGTMLAAETIKALVGSGGFADASSSIRIQYFDPPSSPGARPELRDRDCPKCGPDNVLTGVWRRRLDALTSGSNPSPEMASA
jgi:hypothetical protein